VKDQQGGTDVASTSIIVTAADTTPPALLGVASGNPDKVVVTFSKPIEQAGAETLANYSLDQGAKVLSAALGVNLSSVTLTTSPLAENGDYTLAVANVKDRARQANVIAPDSRKTFRCSNLFAHWRLDDGQGDAAVDASGGGHHGIMMGSQGGPVWAKSTRGNVLSFDGVDDIVETDTFLRDLAMPFSITLWVNPAATQMEYACILGNHGEPFVGINLQQDGKKANLYSFGYGDGKRWQGVGQAQLQADEWQHVAVVCDGETAILYVNGAEKARAAAKGPLAPNRQQNFKLGQGYHTGRYFHGSLSDVRIHRKALSAEEVANLAKASATR
jgi:hypothetical protein